MIAASEHLALSRDAHLHTERGAAGAGELRRPLGITIIGGLVVSQLLTLYLTPVVYTYMATVFRPRRAAAPAPAGIESLRSATTTTVPARSGSLMAGCAIASTSAASTTARSPRSNRVGIGHSAHTIPSGMSSASQTGWERMNKWEVISD